jgi:hypothetical protein
VKEDPFDLFLVAIAVDDMTEDLVPFHIGVYIDNDSTLYCIKQNIFEKLDILLGNVFETTGCLFKLKLFKF